MLDILKQKPGLIGLDIGHDSIKMIQLSRTDDDHRIFAAAAGTDLRKLFGHHLVSLTAVKIIGIDNRKRFVDRVFGYEYRMPRTPGLFSPFAKLKIAKTAIQFLIDVFDFDKPL